MYQGPQSIKDFRQNTGTVYYRNGVSTNRSKNSKNGTEDNIERTRDMVLFDRQLTIDEVAHVLQISHGSA